MNNDTNNNLNGTVLGNVNNNPLPNDTIETLDGSINSTIINNQVMNNSAVEPMASTVNPEINQNVNNQVLNNSVLQGQSDGIVKEMPQPSVIQTPQVEPAYTNPQMINPAPNPGFENSNTIGTTPPISLEPEKSPKKKTNKVGFIILVLIILAGVGFGTYYVLNYTDLLNKEKINIVTKDLNINIGDNLSTLIGDYATITGTDSKNCSLDTSQVDISKEGIYQYKVTCGVMIKTGNLTVIDNTELVVETKTVYKVKTDILEAKEFALEEDNNLTYEFVDQNQVDTIFDGDYGTYTVRIKVSNQNNKTTEFDGTLVLMEYPIKGYLMCSSKEQNIEGLNATMTVTEKFAIVDDGNNGNLYGNVAEEIHSFKFSDETEYTTYLASYKSENRITINNITGDTSFNDEELLIIISNDRDNELVAQEYGLDVLRNYSTLKNHFTNILGYTCTYVNEE